MSDAPVVRLANVPGAQSNNVLLGKRGAEKLPRELAPSLLLSYHYYRTVSDVISDYVYRDWALDSGAFSAKSLGVEIDLEAYIDFCLEIMESGHPPVEIFALDVIGEHEPTLRNTERMWDAGIPAIPAYHPGEPEDYLLHLAATYPKIAIGGVANMKPFARKMQFCREVFARVWPKRIHGLGFGSEKGILGLPFHSVDATNWGIGPCRFGQWRAYASKGGKGAVRLPVRGSAHNLRGEIEYYLQLEKRARLHWKKEMAELEEADSATTIRLAVASSRRTGFVKKPTNPKPQDSKA
jgi:hypothetical protein